MEVTMSSTPLSRRGLLGLFAALLGWCRGAKAAPSALAPPKGRVYRILLRFQTTVRGDRRTTRVTALDPIVEVTEALPDEPPPAAWTGTFSVDPELSTLSTYTCESAMENRCRTPLEGSTTTWCDFESRTVTASVASADERLNRSGSPVPPEPSSSDTAQNEGEEIEVMIEYRYGTITLPER
jgi:hypothetical protein